MDVDNVVYIKVKPYTYDLSNEILTNRLKLPILFHFPCIEKSSKDYEIDKIVSKKMMLYLQSFFK